MVFVVRETSQLSVVHGGSANRPADMLHALRVRGRRQDGNVCQHCAGMAKATRLDVCLTLCLWLLDGFVAQLDAQCSLLEIASSSDCGAFDGSWCCYSKITAQETDSQSAPYSRPSILSAFTNTSYHSTVTMSGMDYRQ